MTFKYIELFAGVGGFRSALDPLGGECVFASEIDKYATQAYKALYNGAPELHGDITQIDAQDIPDHDVLVGGFPCQAFSAAGQRKGFEEARGTLFFEIARIASAKQPRLMLLENVKGLLSHDGGKTFETMCAVLNDIGYAIDFRVLNSKHYGVPQNRERIFIVCDRDAEHEEWNVEGTGVVAKAKRRAQALGIRTFNFDFPTDGDVTTRLRDVLETQVDEKYYLSEEKTAKLVEQLNAKEPQSLLQGKNGTFGKINEYSGNGAGPTLTATCYKEPDMILEVDNEKDVTSGRVMSIGNTNPSGNGMNGNVYDSNGLSPTLTTNKGEGLKVTEEVRAVLTPERPEKRQNGRRFKEDGEESFTLTAQDRHGVAFVYREHLDADIRKIAAKSRPNDEIGITYKDNGDIRPHRMDARKSGISELNINHEDNASFTVTSTHAPKIYGESTRYRIRKLTPLECWRLQAFTDAQHDTVKAAGISDSQRYKMAGNAVTVNVISAIGKRLIALLNETKTEVAA